MTTQPHKSDDTMTAEEIATLVEEHHYPQCNCSHSDQHKKMCLPFMKKKFRPAENSISLEEHEKELIENIQDALNEFKEHKKRVQEFANKIWDRAGDFDCLTEHDQETLNQFEKDDFEAMKSKLSSLSKGSAKEDKSVVKPVGCSQPARRDFLSQESHKKRGIEDG